MSKNREDRESVAEREQMRKAVDFQAKIEGLAVLTGEGKHRIEMGKLRELVSAEPEQCVAACRAYVGMAVDRISTWQAYAQFAIAISWAYRAEFEDDTLMVWVADELEASGVDVPAPALSAPVCKSDGPAAGRTEVEHLEVASELLASCDIYPFVVRYSHHALGSGPDEIVRLRQMRGSLVISFDVPQHDPREVWEVPEVRAYVTKLADRLPYLPYYFYPDPKYAMAQVWICCLAPPSAWTGKHLDLMDEVVLVRMAHTMNSLQVLAQLLGDDPEEVRQSVFASLPADFTAIAASVAQQIADLDDEGTPEEHA
ncbi:hypothetical protein AS594_35235 [Streptomyces agglomeratus]|uniref:Uncharacterized protein n=1 Tax=Streptomyces agglomeratus TaxID=285458 RepID=A0A1E5PH95_9ACTN|nr:hypothetical protein [Streptomyces agglomeratus]OEJ28899.1 hypothetical protein AS594_35235 [Streptomyces agglomeratus]